MADISLDDFIRKNNVKVQVKNVNKGQQGKGRFGAKGLQTARNGQTKQVFDARQKLQPRPPIDARDKIIINKKSGKGDARNKIVSNQVQKGKFDARSLIKRQKKANPPAAFNSQPPVDPMTDFALTRTLSNPNAKGRSQIQLTNAGLTVTRPVPSTQVSLTNNSLQITKRNTNRPYGGSNPPHNAQVQKDFVPFIQIRNDRYKQPEPQSSHQYYREPTEESYRYGDPPKGYSSSHSTAVPAFSNQRGYRDLDDPQYNSASAAIQDIPKIRVSNLRPVDSAGMRPVSYSSHAPIRAPPGAATVSQGVRVKTSAPRPGVEPTSRPLQAGTKRRQPVQPPAQEVSGPLRLGKGGGPGIELRTADSQHSNLSIKRAKYEVASADVAPQDDNAEFISPLQGFRVVVTNLFTGVTQDDIIELFGAVGPLKKAKLLKAGTAEVVYELRKDAHSAVQKYHSRELDGQPMYVKMTTPTAAIVKKVAEYDPDITGEALRLYKKGSGGNTLPEAPIEVPTIHRALFKAGPPGPNKSVKFTVKI